MEGLLRYLGDSKAENFILKGGEISSEVFGLTPRAGLVFSPRKKMKYSRIKEEFSSFIEKAGYVIIDLQEGERFLSFKVSRGEKISTVEINDDCLTPRENPSKWGVLKVANLETLLAERIEGLYSGRAATNADLADVCLLIKAKLDGETLNAAFVNTFVRRGTLLDKTALYTFAEAIPEAFGKNFDEYAKANNLDLDIERAKTDFKTAASKYLPVDLPLPKSKIKLTLVRHGKDDPVYVGGWSESPLTKEGRKQIEATRERLSGGYDVFIASDLTRTRQTAEIINERFQMPVVYSQGFRETNNGIFANMLAADFQRHPQKVYFADLKYFDAYPFGESPKTFFERAYKSFVELLETYNGKSVILVTHGGIMTVIECILNAYPYNSKVKIAPENGEICEYDLEIK